MIKPDRWIRTMALEHGMIEPFAEATSGKGVISYGLSSYGYDMRIADTFKIFRETGSVDPKNQSDDNYEDIVADVFDLPGRTAALGRSVEYFRIPRNILTITYGKSTYARCGLLVNVTPFEPEWEGYATISLTNSGPRPVRVYAGEGIAQLLFLEASEICETSYKDKNGKYQAQQQITLSKNDKVE